MVWFVLVLAGLCEIVWAYAMNQSVGFPRPLPTAVMFAAMLFSFCLLAWSMRVLPLGTAWTIWTGIGAVGAFIVGAVVLGEPLGLMRIVAAVLIVSDLILMKLATPVKYKHYFRFLRRRSNFRDARSPPLWARAAGGQSV